MKLRGFKQILYVIKNADSIQRNEPDFFKEQKKNQPLTKEQQVEFMLNQEKIRNTIQEVLDFNKSKINRSSQNKDLIGLTESQKVLFKALEQIDNYEFIDQYFLYKKQFERQKKMDSLFKERIVDYRKRISCLKAKDCMKDQVIKLHQDLTQVPFEKRAKQTDNMRFFIHKCQTLIHDRQVEQQDQKMEAMKLKYVENVGSKVRESKNNSMRQSISQLYEDVRRSHERETSKERNPLQDYDFESINEPRKSVFWQCQVRNSKSASTVTQLTRKPAFRIKKQSNEVQSSALSKFKNGSIKEKIGPTETLSGSELNQLSGSKGQSEAKKMCQSKSEAIFDQFSQFGG
mmetsp:Transcript_44617/g.43258  ORF Transcript_44617/g.43258 Transcript_44617/m.43258 type:complete len:345 (+) Transcript_44617:149-1183(+)